MDVSRRPGFSREDLRPRYDIFEVREDDWHSHTDVITRSVLGKHLYSRAFDGNDWVLNAGAGVTTLELSAAREISLDLFESPICRNKYPVCGSVAKLPFPRGTFAAIVCVGEVLAYCNPSEAFAEFANTIKPDGILICDFGSTKSLRHFGTSRFAKSAVVLTSLYNGLEEKTWIYHPDYILNRLSAFGFDVVDIVGAHAWSTIASRLGVAERQAIAIERQLSAVMRWWKFSDTITVVARPR